MTVELARTEVTERTGGSVAKRHLLPALGLFLLAPLVGEFLLGNLPINSLGLLLVLAPLYGGGALLIRETGRRWRLGWPGILVLCIAFGLVEEAFVTQSLFNPNYVGLRLLDYGYVAGLGISAWWTVFVLGIHAIWSTAVPIALVESFTPATRRTPWLGYVGLAVAAVLFVLACALLFFFQLQDFFMAAPAQFIGAAVVVAILIALAVALRRLPPRVPDNPQGVPNPWLVGAIFFVLGSAFMLLARTHEPIPAALNVAGLLALLAVGALLLWRWSGRVAWSPRHELAAAGGLLLTYAWYGFVQIPSAGSASPQVDLLGNAIFAAGALALLAAAAGRLHRRPQSAPTVLLALLLAGALAGCTPVAPVLPNAAPSPLAPPAPASTPAAAAPSAPTAGMAAANGITLAYESFGPTDGEAILLIGGTGMQLVDWPMALVDALVEKGYRVIRYDNRDVGLSTHFTDAGLPDAAAIQAALMAGEQPDLPYTLRDMAADAAGLLDALGIDRAHIVGASMGGAIAQLVAIDYPTRTLSLTTLMADSANPALPVVARPEAFAGVPPQPPAGDRPEDRAAYLDWQVKTWQALAGPDYPMDAATLESWAERNYARSYDPAGGARQGTAIVVDRFDPAAYRRSHLGAITAPTVIVQGDADPIVPPAAAEDLASLIPGADLRMIRGLGHNIPAELVPEIAAAILAAAGRG